MPYAHINHGPNSTLADYLSVDDALRDDTPEGLLLTILGADDAGLHVIDLWESKAHAGRFAAERLSPAFTRTGRGPDADAIYAGYGDSSRRAASVRREWRGAREAQELGPTSWP